MLHTVVMAGGSGTRFWPQSRKSMPKQLLNLVRERTMIQDTVARCLKLSDHDHIWIATNQALDDGISIQLPDATDTSIDITTVESDGIPFDNILIEPTPRNTAPCIGLAAVHLLKSDPEAVMLVVSSDHVIQPEAGFIKTINQATTLIEAKPDTLVLIGIPPTDPATGYGYIESGPALDSENVHGFQVKDFKEKPDSITAQHYCDSGNYHWNCGIFVWKARTILDALAQFEPEMHKQLLQISNAIGTPQYEDVLNQVFPAMKSESIDYAVLEHAKQNLAVIPAAFEWDDVGNWNTLQKYFPADANGNTIVGLHCGLETSNNIIISSNDHLVATFGIENCLIVHTPDATLMARKDDESAVKQLVNQLEERGYERFL